MVRVTSMSDDLPAPAGPYSHAVGDGTTVYSSGQGGASADGALSESVATQCAQCFSNVLGALAAGGASEIDVVKVTVYLTDTAHFAEMNVAYAAAFTHPYPARTTVYVTLPAGMVIEVDAIAIIKE